MPLHHLRTPAVRLEISELWRLSWPILIGQLATVGMNVADVAMAGHASAEDLAGVSLGVSLWHIAIVTLMGLLMSVNPTVAQHVGAGARERIGPTVLQALWKALGAGLLAMGLLNLVAVVVLGRLHADPVVLALARDFVLVISFALPAFCAFRVLYGYSASIDQTRPMMVIALGALALNIAVNWLLVYGNLGFPRLGGVGCAWATLLCIHFELAVMVWWIRRTPAYQDTSPFTRFAPPQWQQIRSLLRLGVPISITYFAETSAFSMIALLVAGFGTTEVAAHQIALNFISLVFMLPMSLGIALLTRVGQALGAGDPVAARFRAWTGVSLVVGTAALASLGMALFNHGIASLYTRDLPVAALAAHLLVIAAIFQLSDSTQVVVACAVRAYKVTRVPMFIHLGSFWGLALPLGCVLGLAPAWLPWRPVQAMGAEGFWIALVVGLSVAAVSLLWLLQRLSLGRAKAALAGAC